MITFFFVDPVGLAPVDDVAIVVVPVGAALRPGQPDSGGAQFFVCVTDQPALAGQFTVFGRVSDGLDVVQQISQLPADAKGAATE